MKDNLKLIIGTVIVIVILLVCVAGLAANNKVESLPLSNDPEVVLANAEKEAKEVKASQKKVMKDITVNDYLAMYEGDKESLVFFTKSSCYNCELAETILQGLMKKYRIDINKIEVDILTEDAYNAIIESDPYMENFGTPMLFLVGNNSIIDSVDGLTDKAHYLQFFKLNAYV